MNINRLFCKIIELLRYTISPKKWESYLEFEKKNWRDWFKPSLYTWKDRFESLGYKIDLDENKPLSSENCIKWWDFQRKLDLNFSGKILIVDVGSGPSGIGYCIRGENVKVTCLDPLLDEYQKIPFYRENVFKKLDENIILFTGVGESIPLENEIADVVFCINVLDHSKNPASVLDEIKRILKKKGVLVLDVDVWISRKPIILDVHPSRMTKKEVDKIIKQRFLPKSQRYNNKSFSYGGIINKILLSLQQKTEFGEIFYVLEKK